MTYHFFQKLKIMKLKLLITLLIFIILESTQLLAQTKGLSNFYGNSQMGEDICVRSGKLYLCCFGGKLGSPNCG
jgi:hypothetical protein